MPYVKRDNENNIIETSETPDESLGRTNGTPDHEWLADNDQEVIDFLNPPLVTEYTAQEIRNMFTDAEYKSVLVASKTDDDLLLILNKLSTRLIPMKPDEQSVIDAANYINSIGLASQEFKNAFGLA